MLRLSLAPPCNRLERIAQRDPPAARPRARHREEHELVSALPDSILLPGRSEWRAWPRLFARLRARKVVEWVLAYLALAWIGLQATDALREIWSWPVAVSRAITLALALGLLPAGVVAWFHGEPGRDRVCTVELVILTTLCTGSSWIIWVFSR